MTKPLRIAVADDEPDVRDYFRRILPVLGHTVVVAAADGSELVASCREEKPDLIIADVRMPVMDGDEAIHEICRDRPTPFILVSAYSKNATIPNGLGVGWEYLTKPINRYDLEGAIAKLFDEDEVRNGEQPQ
jgi:two-component system, response regulator PdtaR